MKKNRYFLLITIFVIFISSLHLLNWPFFSGKFFYPFKFFFSSFAQKIGEPISLMFIKQDIFEENKRLQVEVARLISKNVELGMVEEENERLRKEMSFIKKENYKFVLANVVGKREEGGLVWFVLDRGSQDGVEEGFVGTSQGTVVGKIAKVTKNNSYLLSLFDEKVKMSAEIIPPAGSPRDRERIEGIVQGRGGLVIELDLVPLDKKINNQDWVITAGLEYVVPRGLFIGILREVTSKPTEVFYKAVVETSVRIESLEMVNIIIPEIK